MNRPNGMPRGCHVSGSRTPASRIPALLGNCLVIGLLVTLFLESHGQSVAAAPSSENSRPNIVVFLVDDMGVMDSSVPFLTDEKGQPKRYPLNEFYRTPNMERLAARGIRFSNFYAMNVCSPSRISLMTGQSAARHRTTNWINPDANNRGPFGPPDWNWQGLSAADITLPRLLKQAGYRTIHIGKGHFGPRHTRGEDPKNLGFDVNIAGASIGQPGSYYGMHDFGLTATTKKNAASNAVPHLEKYHQTETFLTEALTLEAQRLVSESVSAGKPFYLNFAQYAVHAPFHSDPRFAKHYVNSGKPPPAQAFATLIEGMDKSLGDLLNHLEKLGIAENTLILFLGDNGSDAPLGSELEIACAAPLRGKKGAHYEGGMRVPFIAAWAKPNSQREAQQALPIAANSIQQQVGVVYDLFPTILAVAGCTPPTGHVIDGSSLATLLSGSADAARDEVFLMHYPHAPHRGNYFTSYRRGDWKAIYHYRPTQVSEGSHYQLFNLASDPTESENLAQSRPEELRRMMREMITALEQQHALYPVADDGQTPLKPQLPSP